MTDGERPDTTIYQVVVNHEEQYSFFPADKKLPLGWSAVGKKGTKAEVLAYIEQVWEESSPLRPGQRTRPR